MANTFTYTVGTSVGSQEYRSVLQARLMRPTNWKEVVRVEYTDKSTINNPYMSTTPSVQDGTRGTAFSFQDYAVTNDTLLINDYDEIPMYVDWADLAQLSFDSKMEVAERQGQLINERLENLMLSKHAAWTDFDNASIGGTAGNITVSASTIDDIIRGQKRELREGNGRQYWSNGLFTIWRPADFEYLEAFVQAYGFNEADKALKDGILEGFRYMGMDHYVSNDHTAGHLFGGIKRLTSLGINRATFGQPKFIEFPAGGSGGVLSGLGIYSRVDFQFETWETIKTLQFDILVA